MPRFADLFAHLLQHNAPEPRRLPHDECTTRSGQPCTLCHARTLDYPVEAALKEQAATSWWNSLESGVPISPLVRSPRGRAYRTVTKRKAFPRRNETRLGFIGPADNPTPGGLSVDRCPIEPRSHAEIYRAAETYLASPRGADLHGVLQYVIIKGNYREESVIVAVKEFAPAVVRAANGLSRHLTRQLGSRIAGVFLFEGDPEGRYYLETRDRGRVPRARKLFGRSELYLRAAGRPFLYPPLSFSQVNESLLGLFVAGARDLLVPEPNRTLYDFYCGYGLFALSFAAQVKHVIGIEGNQTAVAAARDNAARQNVVNSRFLHAQINEESIDRILARGRPGSLALLDPPRGGTAKGVLERMAASEPARILHVFCNTEILPAELQRWESAGYRVSRAVPFDMFPGTDTLEVMVLLEPRQGIRSKGTSRTG